MTRRSGNTRLTRGHRHAARNDISRPIMGNGGFMPQLFVAQSDASYGVRALISGACDLRGVLRSAIPAVDAAAEPPQSSTPTDLMSFGPVGNERWVVLAGVDDRVYLNGLPIQALGIQVLAHRDEIHLPGLGTGFYSEERLPSVVPFPITGREVPCGRCRQAIKPGAPAVRCPRCGTWYDQSPELNCYEYASTCSFCPTPTVLGGDFSWTPDEV